MTSATPASAPTPAAGFGVRSMVGRLRRVAVRPPGSTAPFADAHWAQPLDVDLLGAQHAAFVALLIELGCGVELLRPAADLADACFVYDPAFVVGSGVIELRQAKPARTAEPPLLVRDLQELGVPVIGRLTSPATADGGDMLWLDRDTLAVGRTYRTNQAAVDQLRAFVVADGVGLESFDMPHDQGPEFCLHLMSVISPLRDDLAVVYEPLAPVALLQALDGRGIERVVVPDEEYPTLACNILAVAPGIVVMPEGNPRTAALLRERGVEVHTYAASEINKGEGGPTCLTRPIARD